MSRRIEYYFIALIVVTSLAIVAHGQDKKDPAKPKMTNGVFGAIEVYFWPFTSVLLQFINSVLMHVKGEQLPCTIYDLANMKYKCTPLTAKVQGEGSKPMPS